MFYAYILRSIPYPERTYVGYSTDLKTRIAAHNSGTSAHTAKFRPWHLECYIAFDDEPRARLFERYLKTSSGKAFSNKRLTAAV